MSPIHTDVCHCATRDLADLLKNPSRPLSQEEEEHFDEYMSFKNHSKSAADVNLTDTVKEVVSDIDYYLGFKREKG
ncbi:MAG: hypothetical protein LBB74_07715 [Chitinispirillales bacterium]|nr:hypothetical protein [Chitinispirillales bacterium]